MTFRWKDSAADLLEQGHALPLFLLLALTVLTYREVTTHSFLINWADQVYVTKNPTIQGFSRPNLKDVFTRNYVGNYAPVQIISFMNPGFKNYFVRIQIQSCISQMQRTAESSSLSFV